MIACPSISLYIYASSPRRRNAEKSSANRLRAFYGLQPRSATSRLDLVEGMVWNKFVYSGPSTTSGQGVEEARRPTCEKDEGEDGNECDEKGSQSNDIWSDGCHAGCDWIRHRAGKNDLSSTTYFAWPLLIMGSRVSVSIRKK